MPTTTTLLLFALAVLILTATPGPGVLYVWARTLAQGRRAGFASMFGIESGEVVWLIAAASGVAALLSTSLAALTVLRFAGAAYLIFLGVQRWRAVGSPVVMERSSLSRTFAQGLVTQLLNPKVAIFFVAFLPQFLNPAHPIAQQVLALGAVYIAIALVVDTSYVITAAAVSHRFLQSQVAQRRVGRISAATYVALGLVAGATGARSAA